MIWDSRGVGPRLIMGGHALGSKMALVPVSVLWKWYQRGSVVVFYLFYPFHYSFVALIT